MYNVQSVIVSKLMIGLEVRTKQACLPYTGIYVTYTLHVISYELFPVISSHCSASELKRSLKYFEKYSLLYELWQV